MSAGRICSRTFATAFPGETVRAAAQRMQLHGVGSLVVVEPGANLDALRRLVRDFFHEPAADRVRFAELRSITVFAQDNARAARDSQDRPVLLIPRLPPSIEVGRDLACRVLQDD